MRALLLLLVVGCAGSEAVQPAPPVPPPDAGIDGAPDAPPDASPDAPPDAPIDAWIGETPFDFPPPPVVPPISDPPEAADIGWRRGSLHVHAQPSGDSKTPIPEVIKWYEDRKYDFIVLTDHNKVSEVSSESTAGRVAVREPKQKTELIVLAGVELTHNPDGCQPPAVGTDKCRIHVNLLGVTGRPPGEINWADRSTNERLPKYLRALEWQKQIGGLAQINHPQWHWGMTKELFTELGRRGFTHFEIENAQFADWLDGDPDHPSMDELWDAALAQGVVMYGTSSDDAHHYNEPKEKQKWPAGGAWVQVRARRTAKDIFDAVATGRFYSTNGVTLSRVDVERGELVVYVANPTKGRYAIDFIENGRIVATVWGAGGRRELPAKGYLRAVVRRLDGKDAGQRAWIQPRRR